MSGYLWVNDPDGTQWNAVRRNRGTPSGVVVLHTAENITDFIDIDLGAETVAKWIARRNPLTEGYGSYHTLCDSDSTVQMLPWTAEAFHDTRTNNHSVGISGAIKSADWKRLGARGSRIVVRMALAARQYANWLKTTAGITIPARRISQAQAMNRVPGFVAHGTMDPGRRSDPGVDFDWDLFFAIYNMPALAAVGGAIVGTVPNIPDLVTATLKPIQPLTFLEEILSAEAVIAFFSHGGKVYEANLLSGTYRHVPNPTTLHDRKVLLTRQGIPWYEHTPGVPVANPAAFGVPLVSPADIAEVAARVSAIVVPQTGGAGLSADQTREIVEQSLRSVFGSLAEPV